MTAPTYAQELVRLRQFAELLDTSCNAFHLYRDEAREYAALVRESAATISRLQAENEKMRAMLRDMTERVEGNWERRDLVSDSELEACANARAALTQSAADALEGG